MRTSGGILRVVSPVDLAAHERAVAQQAQEAASGKNEELSGLIGYVRRQFEIMRVHRASSSGWNHRLLNSQRVFNGEYEAAKLQEIKKFGGSDVYARVTAVKCRGATALLRDIYLSGERPWGIDPTPDPVLPDHVTENVKALVQSEVNSLVSSSAPIDPDQIKDRINSLMDAARRANTKRARAEATKAESKLDDILVEGGFYEALAEVLVDLPIFSFACLKGPVVRIVPTLKWVDGKPQEESRPRMFWERVSPFDIYFTPGVSVISDGSVAERVRYTRADLNALIDLPGYDREALLEVLDEHGRGGLNDWLDATDSERAHNESRENPWLNRSEMIGGIEFHGSVQGQLLLEHGVPAQQVPDPKRDYFVQMWIIGRHIIKIQMSPSLRKRHPYYITSFEKVPGTPVGNALPDILDDIQGVCNATLRALVNNLSISSGPQVVVDMDRLSPGENADELYPWKRWRVTRDPMVDNSGSNNPPVNFFQPTSNAQELLGVYEKFVQIADDLSAIPRYTTGSDRLGGAGRTASGLAMLMGNANKVLQNVAANIDREIIEPVLYALYDMVMLTDQTGILRGDESIRVRGVAVAIQRETNRQRQIEFLQATANPIDTQIMGVKGRAQVLKAVSNELGLDGASIVPSEEELDAQKQKQDLQAMQAQMAQGAGAPPADGPQDAPGQPSPKKPSNQDLGVPEAGAMRGMAG